ncbi:PepSY domain-containing protein [Sandaracinobacter sp. RS1-74]|uniref:PepSY-associated TM helix domain-containing protein n=1 Tax=Sandaracinobacteroides sayramensis TaxID=2913411 RepID=UPI001EDC5764|nr:PepSY domain-containing protein [Sandaracinobacteroides sayramensis]MCG2840149.1 PepSY domain-containing protein [Sandaracinobacteroides sayramensis]
MAKAESSRRYRAIWRWHFWAGLIVAPFLLILSVTGAIYLFDEELNDLLMPELHFVEPVHHALPPSALIRAAIAEYPGTPTRIDIPDAADRPAKVHVRPHRGEPLHVMVDPASGRVLGSFVYTRTLVGFADVMHGSLTLGERGDAIVELAACWALVLIATGLYLWWPRGRWKAAGILYPRLSAKGRLFWRDVHGVAGVWSLALILFLLLTGLPWAVVQGPLIRGGMEALGIGAPQQAWGHMAPASQPMGKALGRISWTQETAPMPVSDPVHSGHHGEHASTSGPDEAAIAGADSVFDRAAKLGMARGYRLYLPQGETGIYTALAFPGRPQGQRTLHFDRWSHELLREYAWSQYGVGAKAVELGVQIHMGRYFGLPNQLLMLFPCLAIVLLVGSGIAMWWKRRPAGAFAAPPRAPQARMRGALWILAVAGMLMPLLGLSLILVWLIDKAAQRFLTPPCDRPAASAR